MTRTIATAIVCTLAVLGLIGSPAAGQTGERPPERLWDEFPLDPTPTPTPAPAAAVATPEPAETRPAIVPATDDDGISRAILIPLLGAAAALGALAAHTAGRRRKGDAAPPAVATVVDLPRKRAAAARRARRPRQDGSPRSVAPPRSVPPPRSVAPPPAEAAPAAEAAPPAEAKPRAEAKPPTEAAPPAEAKPLAEATPPAEAKPPTETAPPAEAKPLAEATPPAEAKPPTETAPLAEATPPAEPPAAKRAAKPRRAKRPAKAPKAPRGCQAAPHPAPGQGARGARRQPAAAEAPREAPAAPRPQPVAPLPPARPPREAPVAPVAQDADPHKEWETCRVKVHSRSIKSHFYAVPYEGGPVIARSPYFKVNKHEGDAGIGPSDALRALVADLNAAGWYQSGAGRVAWDLRFSRVVEAPRPVGRPG